MYYLGSKTSGQIDMAKVEFVECQGAHAIYRSISTGRLYACKHVKSQAAGEWRKAYNTQEGADACKREQRNKAARNRNSVMRSLGLKKTPYGWE